MAGFDGLAIQPKAAQITQEQYLRLLEGLEVIETPAIRKDVKYREVL